MRKPSKKQMLRYVGKGPRHFDFGGIAPDSTRYFNADEVDRYLALKDESGNVMWQPVKVGKDKEIDHGEKQAP